ncbi:MAG: hypothetical protein BWY74_02942 [Firmicutes bacterium ADurb.Bin419]|nr:MAG: hypothetical protein BWY74_02942 [Firmicutes bacterium ADurb.Bin419]
MDGKEFPDEIHNGATVRIPDYPDGYSGGIRKPELSVHLIE